jgi:hypothetical protein
MYHVDMNLMDIVTISKRNHFVKTMLEFFVSEKMILKISSRQPRLTSLADFKRIEILQLGVIIFDKINRTKEFEINSCTEIKWDYVIRASLLIAYKFHITCYSLIDKFESDNITRDEIINMEYRILENINYKIWYFTIHEQLIELLHENTCMTRNDTCITHDDIYITHDNTSIFCVESICIYYSMVTIFFGYYAIITDFNLVGKLHVYLKSIIVDDIDIIYKKISDSDINKLFLSMWHDVYISDLIDNHIMFVEQEILNKFINISKKIRETEILVTSELITKISTTQ